MTVEYPQVLRGDYAQDERRPENRRSLRETILGALRGPAPHETQLDCFSHRGRDVLRSE